MKLVVWGARGSVPTPDPESMRYGGNTACVQLTTSDGTVLILDAGTGIRQLGLRMARPYGGPINVLLTHLHLDHIQGLTFFEPALCPDSEIVVWGPAASEGSLQDRILRCLSAPLVPMDVRELPCRIHFREAGASEWRIGAARVRAEAVNHRGPTLGYRITDGDASVCFIPDHEPVPGGCLETVEDERISGLDLARDASLLIHDCQYTDEQYLERRGWGHACLSQTLAFARRAAVDKLLLFHHDPQHSDDFLDRFGEVVAARWAERGGRAGAVQLAVEREELDLARARGDDQGARIGVGASRS